MKPSVHILNGDSLAHQFPSEIEGNTIVCRECLVVGNVGGTTLQEFYNNRASFIVNTYKGYSTEDYYRKTVSEFEELVDIPKNTEINLWFEDDVFCQVNFWFMVHQLDKLGLHNLFLVRPSIHTQYGFSGFNSEGLITIFNQKTEFKDISKLSLLWEAFKNEAYDRLLDISEDLQNKYPFICNAVKAYIASIPSENNLGRPSNTLLSISKELQTTKFSTLYKEFCKREPIYGYGDLHVKTLIDALKEEGLM